MALRAAFCLLFLLAGCGSLTAPSVTPVQLVLNPSTGVAFKNPLVCSVDEVSTSWLAKNVYALCEDSNGNVIAPVPGNATSGGQAIVNAFSSAAAAGTVIGVAATAVPSTFKLVAPAPAN